MPATPWLSTPDCDPDAFRALVDRTTEPAEYSHATAVERNVPVYDAGRVRDRRAVQAELVHALTDGPGIVVFRGAFPGRAVVDRVSAVFDALIAEQRASGARTDLDSEGPAGRAAGRRRAATELFHGAGDDWREQAAARLPMGRLGRPEEIADFVVFPLSERSGVVTGSVIDWDRNVLGGLD